MLIKINYKKIYKVTGIFEMYKLKIYLVFLLKIYFFVVCLHVFKMASGRDVCLIDLKSASADVKKDLTRVCPNLKAAVENSLAKFGYLFGLY